MDSTQAASINHISLCAGYGGIDIALSRVVRGLRTVAFSEIEAFPCANLVAKMEAGLLDTAPIWNDLKSFPWERFHRLVDIVSGGFPCFAAGTLILTYRGYVAIESVRIGDRVLTHNGRWRKVTALMHKPDAPLRRVAAQGVPGVITTDEHPFFAREGRQISRYADDGKRFSRGSFTQPEWIEAKDLSGRFVSQVLPCLGTVKDEHSVDFWWLVGWYLAEGWRVKRLDRGRDCGRVVLCCNKQTETEMLAERIKRAGFHFTFVLDRTAAKFHIVHRGLYRFLRQFGKGAEGKLLPGFVFELVQSKSEALMQGYLAGDGSRYRASRGGEGYSVSTVSKPLALGIALLAQRVFGVVASVRLCVTEKRKLIEGRLVNQRDFYQVRIPDRNRSAFVEGDYGWKLVRKSEPCGRGEVFNLAVEGDESYVADGAVVHNCQPFSAAGKRGGDEDPRHLFPHILRGLTSCRPSVVFLENVEGIISAKLKGDGWNDPAGTPVLLHVLRELERVGYRATAGVFSSREVGASHQRKRVFILGVADTESGGTLSEKQSGRLCVLGGSSQELANPLHDGHAAAERPSGARPSAHEGWLREPAGMGSSQRDIRLLRPLPPGPSQWWWEPTRILERSPRIQPAVSSEQSWASSLSEKRKMETDGDLHQGYRLPNSQPPTRRTEGDSKENPHSHISSSSFHRKTPRRDDDRPSGWEQTEPINLEPRVCDSDGKLSQSHKDGTNDSQWRKQSDVQTDGIASDGDTKQTLVGNDAESIGEGIRSNPIWDSANSFWEDVESSFVDENACATVGNASDVLSNGGDHHARISLGREPLPQSGDPSGASPVGHSSVSNGRQHGGHGKGESGRADSQLGDPTSARLEGAAGASIQGRSQGLACADRGSEDPEEGSVESRLGLCVDGASNRLGSSLTHETNTSRAYQALLALWHRNAQEEIQWSAGGSGNVLAEAVLQSRLQFSSFPQRVCFAVWAIQAGDPVKGFGLPAMWLRESARDTSRRSEPREQLSRELAYALCVLSYRIALERGQEAVEGASTVQNVRESGAAQWVLSETLAEVQEVWRSQFDEETWTVRAYDEATNVRFSRVDELRLLGNGVDPDVAAKAFVTLYNRLNES